MVIPLIYILFLMLPIYWLVAMSFKTTNEILSGFTLFPRPSPGNYATIFTDPTWYWGYINSIIYVTMNTVISVAVALPAAYAFSRYRFVGDKHLFFWLLTNRMAPAAVFALPFFQLYSAVGLFDTHLAVALAHCLFNIPLAVWILEGFMSGVPKELDETAYVDGYSFPRLLHDHLPAGHQVRGRRRRLLLLHVLLGGTAACQDADGGCGEADCRP
jgi:glycerol transport system permease protein